MQTVGSAEKATMLYVDVYVHVYVVYVYVHACAYIQAYVYIHAYISIRNLLTSASLPLRIYLGSTTLRMLHSLRPQCRSSEAALLGCCCVVTVVSNSKNNHDRSNTI